MKLHSNIFGWEYVWEDFADEHKGSIVKDGTDSEAHVVALHLPVREFSSTISVTNSGHGTELVASYAPADQFAMRLFIETAIHKVEKAFGLQDIKIGDRQFDSKFVIQSNEPERLSEVFSSAELREAILAEQIAEIRIFPNASGMDPRWEVTQGQSVIACTYNIFLDKFEQLDATYKILKKLLAQFKATGLLFDPADSPQTATPGAITAPSTSGRLHSPLLGR